MPLSEISVGGIKDAAALSTIKASCAEFISMLIFVFAGQGSALAYVKVRGNGAVTADGLVAIALAHGFGLAVGVAVSKNISGSHVNPAVTFGIFLGGNKSVSLIKLVFYWVAQFLGSIIACLLLELATNGMNVKAATPSEGMAVGNALVMEVVLTFGLVYTVYATAVDRNRDNMDTIAPLMIGLIVGANILVGGPFDGASMNPAAAFGSALVSGTWSHHWVYWLGPLIGGGLAGLTFEAVTPRRARPSSPTTAEA